MESPKKRLASKLRELAAQTGISQKRISDITGLKTTTVNRIFQGKQGVRDTNLALILGAIGARPEDVYNTPVPPNDVVVKAATESKSSELVEIKEILRNLKPEKLSDEESDLLRIFRALNSKGQDIVLDFARTTLQTHALGLRTRAK